MNNVPLLSIAAPIVAVTPHPAADAGESGGGVKADSGQ